MILIIIIITICGLGTQLVLIDNILTTYKTNLSNILSSIFITIAGEITFYQYAITNTKSNNCIILYGYSYNVYFIYFAIAFFAGLLISALLKINWQGIIKQKIENKIDKINL